MLIIIIRMYIQNQNDDDGGDFAGVPDPVTIVSGSAGVNAYSYLLRWTVPMTGGAEITNYKVEYALVSQRNDTLLSLELFCWRNDQRPPVYPLRYFILLSLSLFLHPKKTICRKRSCIIVFLVFCHVGEYISLDLLCC